MRCYGEGKPTSLFSLWINLWVNLGEVSRGPMAAGVVAWIPFVVGSVVFFLIIGLFYTGSPFGFFQRSFCRR